MHVEYIRLNPCNINWSHMKGTLGCDASYMGICLPDRKRSAAVEGGATTYSCMVFQDC